MQKPIKILLYVLLFIWLISGSLFLLLITSVPFHYLYRDDFNKDKWMHVFSCEGMTEYDCMFRDLECSVRWYMRNNVIEYELKADMKKETVIELLGLPDRGNSEEEISYHLGMCSGFRIDEDHLHVYFGEDGGLVKAGRIQH